VVKNIDFIPGYGLKVHGIVVLPQEGEIYILCNAPRKSVVRMQFLTECKMGILSLGVKMPCAKLNTHPI
jgi:acylphosphatase